MGRNPATGETITIAAKQVQRLGWALGQNPFGIHLKFPQGWLKYWFVEMRTTPATKQTRACVLQPDAP